MKKCRSGSLSKKASKDCLAVYRVDQKLKALETDIITSFCMLSEQGRIESFLAHLCGNAGHGDFAIYTHDRGQWRMVYRAAVAIARRFNLSHQIIADALNSYASSFDPDMEWDRRVNYFEEAVAEYRRINEKQDRGLYRFALLELARVYLKQNFTHQIKTIPAMAVELMLLEKIDKRMDDQPAELLAEATRRLSGTAVKS